MNKAEQAFKKITELRKKFPDESVASLCKRGKVAVSSFYEGQRLADGRPPRNAKAKRMTSPVKYSRLKSTPATPELAAPIASNAG